MRKLLVWIHKQDVFDDHFDCLEATRRATAGLCSPGISV
jgi:hypothetical protein